MFVKRGLAPHWKDTAYTAMPYRLFQGNLNPNDLKRHEIVTESFFFIIIIFC